MNLRVTCSAAFGLVWSLATSTASATTYSCESVEKSASVYAGKESVTKAEDKAAKTCSFSVNGATATSSEADLSFLRSRVISAQSRLNSGNIGEYYDLLPQLLSAAGNNRMNLEELWRDSTVPGLLRQCLSTFASRADTREIAAHQVGGMTLSCRVKKGTREILEISVAAESRVNVLYVPLQTR